MAAWGIERYDVVTRVPPQPGTVKSVTAEMVAIIRLGDNSISSSNRGVYLKA